MPRLARIVVFPIKALDGVEVSSVRFNPSGGLAGDRRFALFDEAGNWINGKRTPAVHAVRAKYADDFSTVCLSAPNHAPQEFRSAAGDAELQRWLSDYFGMTVRVVEDVESGFPDDRDAPGPTVVSTATLAAVAGWFPSLTLDEVRRRFRTNLEIDDCPPFWEDRLYTEDAAPTTRSVVRFRVGEAELHGTNPCARCAVPPRDTATGEVLPNFIAEFQRRRRETLPDWAAPTVFDHFYRLCVNTRLAPASVGCTLRMGDDVTV